MKTYRRVKKNDIVASLLLMVLTVAASGAMAQETALKKVLSKHEIPKESYNDAFADLKGSSAPTYSDSLQVNQQLSARYKRLITDGKTRKKLLDYKGALVLYTEAIELRPDSSKAYLYRAEVKLSLNDFRGAADDFTAVIKKDSLDLGAYKGRAIARLEMKDDAGSVEDYNIIPGILQGNIQSLNCRGEESLNARRYTAAIDDYSRAIFNDHRNKEAYRRRAEANFKLKNYKSALLDSGSKV